jgi:hypothetical protein
MRMERLTYGKLTRDLQRLRAHPDMEISFVVLGWHSAEYAVQRLAFV